MAKVDYDSFIELALQRYSCRSYSDKHVSRNTLVQVLEGARIAPSAVNKQPWKFLVITEEAGRKKVQESYSREWINEAPAFIIALGEHSSAWHRGCDGKDHTNVDISIAVEHICLTATTLGLGTCWVCNFDVAKLCEAFEFPKGLEPIVIIPIGYPKTDDVPSKKRKSLEDIVAWEKL